MELFCIKSYNPHWGVEFQEGNWYTGVEITKNVNLIIDEINYWRFMRLVASLEARKLASNGISQNEIKNYIKGYLTLSEIKSKFCKPINLPFYKLSSESNLLNNQKDFCITNREVLKNQFNLKNIKFDQSIFFLEDYFETRPQDRDKKLKQLLN